jgi:hypothetical protein
VTTHRLTALVVVVGLAVVGFAAGCDLPPSPSRPHLYTMADLEALAAGGDPKATFAEGAGVPGGLRIGDYVTKQADGYHLTLRSTWTEEYRSAYVTGEVWTGFDEVWVQPVYVGITGFDANGAPKLLMDENKPWSPIFSVGPDSAFYSPFWRVMYFQVPEGTDPESFATARKVVDSGLPLIPGPAHTMSLVPGDVVVPPEVTPGAATQQVGGPRAVASGYLDQHDIEFLDFGKNNFSYDDDLVVEPTPLFMLLTRDADGNLQPMNVPTVAGTGPLYANRPANITSGLVPHYGAFWRLYTVEVPAGASIFAPDNVPRPAGADYPPSRVATSYGADITGGDPDDLSQFLGRVALNGANADGTADCFSEYANLSKIENPNATNPCEWLDSQPALERTVPPSWITKTDVLVTCPFVSYRDYPVVVAP